MRLYILVRVDNIAIIWTIAIVAAGVGFTSLGSNFQSQVTSELPSEESRMGTQIIQQSAPGGYISGKGGDGIIPPQDETTAAKEKTGLNAVNVKLATAKLKDELKSNPKTLKLLKVLEDEISKAAKVNPDVAIEKQGIDKAMAKLKDELKSNPDALKLVKELEDEIAQEVENHNSSRSNKYTQ